MKRKVIRVGRRHIEQGKRGNTYECPVGLALKSQAKTDIPTLIHDPNLGNPSAPDVDPLPPEVHQFIVDFDNGKSVKPFKFEIEIP